MVKLTKKELFGVRYCRLSCSDVGRVQIPIIFKLIKTKTQIQQTPTPTTLYICGR